MQQLWRLYMLLHLYIQKILVHANFHANEVKEKLTLIENTCCLRNNDVCEKGFSKMYPFSALLNAVKSCIVTHVPYDCTDQTET